jgi:hypothetical protein
MLCLIHTFEGRVMSNLPSPIAEQGAEPVASQRPAEIKAGVSAKATPPVASPAKVVRAKTPVSAKPNRAVSPAPIKAAANARAGKADGKPSGKKPKLVRDSFSFPALDYARIGSLKQRALKAGHEARKSEVLRAGLAALCALSDAALLKALRAIDRPPPGGHGQ